MGTFEKVELLEETGRDEGVAEVEQEATEQQTCGAQVHGVGPRAHETHRHYTHPHTHTHTHTHTHKSFPCKCTKSRYFNQNQITAKCNLKKRLTVYAFNLNN